MAASEIVCLPVAESPPGTADLENLRRNAADRSSALLEDPANVHLVTRTVRQVACRWRLTAEDIADLTQDTLLRIWLGHAPREPKALVSYARRVATRLIFDRFNRVHAAKRGSGQVVPLAATSDAADAQPSPEAALLGKEALRVCLTKCRAVLSAEEARVFKLALIEGLSTAEIASLVQCEERRVDQRLYRVRVKLASLGMTVARRGPPYRAPRAASSPDVEARRREGS